jgi:hypothetical protein
VLETKMLDLAQWNLIEPRSDRRPARTDHTFVWEQKTPVASLAGDEGARVRMEARVQGEEASGYRVFIHLPEEWERRQNEETLATTAQSSGLLALLGAFIVAVLVVFVRHLKEPGAAAVPWRRLARWCLPVLAAFVLLFVTRLPQYLGTYPTEYSLTNFLAITGIGLLLASAVVYAAVFVLWGLGWFFLARSRGPEHLPFGRAMPAAYYRDSIVVGVCGCAIGLGVARLAGLLERSFPVPQHSLPASAPATVDAMPPALAALANAVTQSYIAIGVLALAAGFAAWYVRRPWMQALLLGVLALLSAPRWGSSAELAQNVLVAWAGLLLVWWAAHRVVQFNLLGYFVAAVLLSLMPAAIELMRQPDFYFQVNGWALLAAALASILWPLIAWRRVSAGVRNEAAANTA